MNESGIWMRMPGTVARIDVGTRCAPVLQILEDRECVEDGGVGGTRGEVRDHAHAACVVFERGVVKVLSHRVSLRGNADPPQSYRKAKER